MLAFQPPPGFHDVSEYVFTAQDRRVIVRSSNQLGADRDLTSVAQDYAAQLQEYLRAANVNVSAVTKRNDGVRFVTVTANLPKGTRPADERAAFVLFGNGISVQISLTARAGHPSAAAEFNDLVQDASPSRPPAPATRLLGPESADEATGVRHAGAATIKLSAEYQDISILRFRNAAGTNLSLRSDDAATVTPTIRPDDRGGSFRFAAEVALPKQPRIRRNGIKTFSVVRQIGGRRVIIHVRSALPDDVANKLAQDVSQSISAGN